MAESGTPETPKMAESRRQRWRGLGTSRLAFKSLDGGRDTCADDIWQKRHSSEAIAVLETVALSNQHKLRQLRRITEPLTTIMSDNVSTDQQKGLAAIKLLETKSGWQRWNEDIHNALLFAGFNDVLNRQPTRPERRQDESNSRYLERTEAWEDKQARALAAARDRCGHNAKNAMKDSETIVDALAAIREQFQPSGSGGYDKLTTEFNQLDLNKCQSVGKLGSEILRVGSDQSHRRPRSRRVVRGTALP